MEEAGVRVGRAVQQADSSEADAVPHPLGNEPEGGSALLVRIADAQHCGCSRRLDAVRPNGDASPCMAVENMTVGIRIPGKADVDQNRLSSSQCPEQAPPGRRQVL